MEIKLVQSREELEQVYRLRYKVYVEEMGLNPAEADHSRGIIMDSLDATARILAAFSDGEVVGTVRLNLARDTDMGEWRDHFQMEQFGPFFPERVSMTSRLIVAPRFRHGTLGLRLAKAVTQLGHGLGVRFDNVSCHARQLALFKHWGYRQWLPGFELEEFGKSERLVFVSDAEYLASARAPLLSALPPMVEDHGSVAFFYENLCEPALALEAC